MRGMVGVAGAPGLPGVPGAVAPDGSSALVIEPWSATRYCTTSKDRSSSPSAQNTVTVARREDNRPDDDPQSGGTTMILVDDVLDFEVEYFDIATSEWSETWDTREITAQPNRLPVQVKISLTVPDERASSRRRTFVTRAEPRNTWALNHAIYIAR